MRPRTDRMIALALLLGAFIIRLVFILETRKLPSYYHPVLDSGFFDQWASFKKATSWIDFAPAFREPLYAYFLAGVYTVLKQSLTMARLAQAVLAGLTGLVLYWSTRSIYGRLAGIAAGVIFALATLVVFFTAELNEATLAIFLVVLSAYFLLRAERSRPYLNAGLAGLLIGAACLTRFATIAALPAWMVHLVLARDARIKKAALAVAVGFVILPAVYQAALVRSSDHSLVPLRIGWNAFIGSGQGGGTAAMQICDVPIRSDKGEYRALVARDRMDGQRDALRLAGIETGRLQHFSSVSRHWSTRALRDFASSPGRYLKTYFTKLGLFWGPSVPPANVDLRWISGQSLILKNILFSFAVLAPLGLVGLARRARTLAGPALFVVIYSLLVSCYLVSDLDKALVVPFLAIFGGTVVSEVVSGVRGGKTTRAVSLALVVIGVGAVLLLLPKAGLDRARQHLILGDIYREQAIFDKAQSSYEEAIRTSPDYPEPYIALSKMSSGAWKAEEALGVLARAPGKAAGDPRLVIEKASVLFGLKRLDEAIALLDGIKNRYPYERRLHEVLGLSLLSKGDLAGGRAELELELQYTGGGFVTYAGLGRATLQLGEYGTAVDYLELAAGINPTDTGVALQLADAYGKLDQYLKACEVLSRVLAADPGSMAVRFKFANSLYHAGRFADALSQFKELAVFDPRNADVLVNLGTVYAAMDSTALAIKTWEKALTLDPANQLARDNLKATRQ